MDVIEKQSTALIGFESACCENAEWKKIKAENLSFNSC